MSILGRVIKTFGSLREPIRRIGQVGLNVGKWVVNNHATLAPLIHGVAMASGNQTAQKISGGLLALSQSATLRKNLNAQNEKVKAEMGRGGYGTYNASTQKMSGYR